ncbi:MAG: hypothetical protein IJT70_00125 [Clostridia bacterium]|nr:hypothetical protein [Clostridia bacterium]
MMEQIYTIPINEAFEESLEDARPVCPFCRIRKKFEDNEIDIILGASMMEPAVRIKTNELGFCEEHYSKMLAAGKKLPVALMLESHLDEVTEKMTVGKIFRAARAKGSAKKVSKVSRSCYICERLGDNFDKLTDNAVHLWLQDSEFRQKAAKQKCYCLPHYSAFLEKASSVMKKSDFCTFSSSLYSVEEKYFAKVKENVSAFIKKFDYRFADEPLDEERDAVEKAISALCGQDPTQNL